MLWIAIIPPKIPKYSLTLLIEAKLCSPIISKVEVKNDKVEYSQNE